MWLFSSFCIYIFVYYYMYVIIHWLFMQVSYRYAKGFYYWWTNVQHLLILIFYAWWWAHLRIILYLHVWCLCRAKDSMCLFLLKYLMPRNSISSLEYWIKLLSCGISVGHKMTLNLSLESHTGISMLIVEVIPD